VEEESFNYASMDLVYRTIGLSKKLGLVAADFRKTSGKVRNWYAVPFLFIGWGQTLRLKDGRMMRLNSIKEYNDLWNTKEQIIKRLGEEIGEGNFKINKNTLEIFSPYKLKFYFFEERQLIETIINFLENFILKQYDNDYIRFDVKGKSVIDIGANVGDTALYFTLSGASHVYAYEMNPDYCRLIDKNIALNKLKGRITPINKRCGGGTVEEALKKYKIGKAVLKIDCEGCEYRIFRNISEDTLRRFDQIILEYHSGYRGIPERLRSAGFQVKSTITGYIINNYTGLIFAERKN
jgi:hypothetical protein